MTDQEQIERLAEWMGWEQTIIPLTFLRKDPHSEGSRYQHWNPLLSLDDCRIVEDDIELRGRSGAYIRCLACVIGSWNEECFLYSTPRQRCEAIIAVIGEANT